MKEEQAIEKLKHLAAMRLLHHMPKKDALKQFVKVYGPTTMDELLEMRLKAVDTWKKLFGKMGEPLSAALYRRKNDDDEPVPKELSKEFHALFKASFDFVHACQNHGYEPEKCYSTIVLCFLCQFQKGDQRRWLRDIVADGTNLALRAIDHNKS